MKAGNIWEDFEWIVSSDYTWRETPLGLALAPANGATVSRTYRPLAKDSAGLFRTFAQLDQTPEAIVGFARQYGSLGPPLQRLPGGGLRLDTAAFAPSGFAAAGLKSLGGTNSLIELFDCEPERGESIAWCWKAQIALMADFVRWLQGSPRIAERDAGLPAEAVEDFDTMMHALQANSVLAATVSPRLTPAGRGRSFEFRFEPRSLLGAMWLQAAQAAAEGMSFRKCASCGRPIAIGKTTGARSDAKFCSDACKSRSYRNRQSRAIELSARGWTAARIAKKFDTTTATVRRWIK